MDIEIDHVAMPVADIERSVEFYQRVIGATADGGGASPIVGTSPGTSGPTSDPVSLPNPKIFAQCWSGWPRFFGSAQNRSPSW